MNQIPDFFTCAVDVKASEEKDSQVDHEQTSRYPTSLAAKSAAPVPLTEIIPLDAVRFGFGLNQEFRGNQFSIRFPMIRKENTDFQPLQEPESRGTAKVVLESVQDLLLKLALQMAREDYEVRRERQRQGIKLAQAAGKYRGRRADVKRRAQVLALRGAGQSIAQTAELTGYSTSQIKRICAEARDQGEIGPVTP
jgi:hypothetical protein